MSKNKYVNLYLKYCTLLPTFVCLNTWSLFLDISLCALLISRPSYQLNCYSTSPIYFSRAAERLATTAATAALLQVGCATVSIHVGVPVERRYLELGGQIHVPGALNIYKVNYKITKTCNQ